MRSSYRLPKSPKSHLPPKFAHAVTTPSFDRCFVRWTTRIMRAWTWRGFSTTSPIQGVPPLWGARGPPGPFRSDFGGPFTRSTYRSPVFEHMWICFAILKCVKRASPPILYLPGRVTASSSAEKIFLTSFRLRRERPPIVCTWDETSPNLVIPLTQTRPTCFDCLEKCREAQSKALCAASPADGEL